MVRLTARAMFPMKCGTCSPATCARMRDGLLRVPRSYWCTWSGLGWADESRPSRPVHLDASDVRATGGSHIPHADAAARSRHTDHRVGGFAADIRSVSALAGLLPATIRRIPVRDRQA